MLDVVIPTGASVTYDAAAGTTFLDIIASSGTVSLAGGQLDIAKNFTTPGYLQTGGKLTGAGNLTVTQQTTMSGGSIDLGGTVSLKSSGDLDLGSIRAGNLIVDISGRLTARDVLLANSIRLLAHSVGHSTGRLRTQAGNLWLLASNSGIWLENDGEARLDWAQSVADIEIDNTGKLETGANRLRSSAGKVKLRAHSPLVVGSGGIEAADGITLEALTDAADSSITVNGSLAGGAGAVAVSASRNVTQNANISGASVSLTSTAGNVTVASGTTTTVASGGTVTLAAAQGEVTRTGASFVGATPTVTDTASIAAAQAAANVPTTSTPTVADTTANTVASATQSTLLGTDTTTVAPVPETTTAPVSAPVTTTTVTTATVTTATAQATGSTTAPASATTAESSPATVPPAPTSGTATAGVAEGTGAMDAPAAAGTSAATSTAEPAQMAKADTTAEPAATPSAPGSRTQTAAAAPSGQDAAAQGAASGAAGAVQAMAAALERRQELKSAALNEAIDQLRRDPAAADLPECGGGGGLCIARPARIERPRVVAPTSASLPQIERKIAVVVAVSDYADPIPSLQTPGRDADAVAEALGSRFGYEVRTLKNPTKADIVREMNRVIGEAAPSDSVMLYYAGHGYVLPETQTGYWIPADGTARSPENWISNRDITRMLNNVAAKQVMLVSDSCFSGKLTEGGTAAQLATGQGAPADILQKRSVTVLSSGGDEPVADQGRGGHSIFAHHLLDTLGKSGTVTVGRNLFENVRGAVSAEFPQQPQYAPVAAAGHESGGDFLFERR